MNKMLLTFLTITVVLLVACGSEPDTPPEMVVAGAAVSPATATPIPLPSPTLLPATEPVLVATATLTSPLKPSSSQPAAIPTATPSPVPTATLTPTPVPDWLNTFGRTADDLMYLGNPNAPVTMIDFSDFM